MRNGYRPWRRRNRTRRRRPSVMPGWHWGPIWSAPGRMSRRHRNCARTSYALHWSRSRQACGSGKCICCCTGRAAITPKSRSGATVPASTVTRPIDGTEDLITDLARYLGDASIAGLLNRLGKKTSKGNNWTRDRVRAFRSHRRIAAYRDGERRERNELVLSEVSARLEVDPSVVRRLIAAGLLPARQACKGAPWIIDAGDLDSPRIVAALAGRRIRVSSPRQAQLEF